MRKPPRHFDPLSRLLHWTMAPLVLAMLFIGVGMVASLGQYARLVAIHKPLGILILVLVTLRLVNRLIHSAPPLPRHLSRLERFAARGSHIALYFLLFALPVVGWGMLSAGAYPIVLGGSLHLPPILPRDPLLYAALRRAHTGLAFALMATVIVHIGAALFHALIYRDGVFESMASSRHDAE